MVVPAEAGVETFLTIMRAPRVPAGDGEAPDEGDRDHRVVIGTLHRETVAVVDVPASGVVTHRLTSGTTRIVVSDVPFAVLQWQSRSGGAGLSVAHPVGW